MSLILRPLLPILRDALAIALLTVIALILAYQVRSRIVVDIGGSRDDFFLSGFHGAENDGTQTYRWTQNKARVELEGQQLAAPWTLQIRLNGYRPNRAAQVKVLVNETPLGEFEAIGEWDIYEVSGNVPGDVWTGNTALTLASDTFIPQNFDANNADKRRLGIALDWLEWAPARSATTLGNDNVWLDFGQAPVVPPLAIVLSWAGALGLLYATARTLGLASRAVNAVFAVLIVLLASGLAFQRPYLATYTGAFLNLALVLAGIAVTLGLLVPRLAAHFAISLHATHRAVLCAIILVCIGLKWGGVWYPNFRSSDLTFHAHRLEFVTRAELFFTSELPDAARRVVPYPPALYVVLSPLAPGVPDYEALLLIANVLADGVAMLALYFAARRLFETNAAPQVGIGGANAALFATFLFAFNPVSFWIYSWGNHTNIFGQMVATLLFCLLLTQPLTKPRAQDHFGASPLWHWMPTRTFFLTLLLLFIAATAHLGVFLSLLAFLVIAVVLRPAARDDNAKRESIALAALLIMGVALAWLLYYAEFTEPLLAQTQTFLNDFGAGRTGSAGGATWKRVSDVLRFTWQELGWVLLLGGILGIPLAWKTFSARARAVWLAWLLVALLFGLVTLGSTFSTRYTLWAAPALALSGGLLLAWLFSKARAAQLGVYALCGLAFAQTLWLWVDRVVNGYQ